MDRSRDKIRKELDKALGLCQSRLEAVTNYAVIFPPKYPSDYAGFEILLRDSYYHRLAEKLRQMHAHEIEIRKNGKYTVLRMLALGNSEEEFYEDSARIAKGLAMTIRSLNVSLGLRKEGDLSRDAGLWR